jgi:hypothetical protein
VTISIAVEGKVAGRPKRPFGQWDVALPSEPSQTSLTFSLRELISHLVEHEVRAFLERQETRRLAQILGPEEIEAGVRAGKVDLGERDLDQEVDMSEAIETALQAFDDGLYYVFVDREQVQTLESAITLQEGSLVTFIRLVALSGG